VWGFGFRVQGLPSKLRAQEPPREPGGMLVVQVLEERGDRNAERVEESFLRRVAVKRREALGGLSAEIEEADVRFEAADLGEEAREGLRREVREGYARSERVLREAEVAVHVRGEHLRVGEERVLGVEWRNFLEGGLCNARQWNRSRMRCAQLHSERATGCVGFCSPGQLFSLKEISCSGRGESARMPGATWRDSLGVTP